jgi:hypothetical protein
MKNRMKRHGQRDFSLYLGSMGVEILDVSEDK